MTARSVQCHGYDALDETNNVPVLFYRYLCRVSVLEKIPISFLVPVLEKKSSQETWPMAGTILLVPDLVRRNMLKSPWVVGWQRVCARGWCEGVDFLHRLPRPRLKHAGHQFLPLGDFRVIPAEFISVESDGLLGP